MNKGLEKNFPIFGLIILFLFNGCQTGHMGAGSGPITFSAETEANFQRYLSDDRGTYFAVSTDGEAYGYSFCAAGSYACTESSGDVVLRSCHSRSRGVPCKIYAMDRTVVWSGTSETGIKKESKAVSIGSGPIEFTEKIERYFQKYKDKNSPEFFAVSPSGKFAGYYHCINYPCDTAGYAEGAISRCESYAKKYDSNEKCYIYAQGHKVVWQGLEGMSRKRTSSVMKRYEEFKKKQEENSIKGKPTQSKECIGSPLIGTFLDTLNWDNCKGHVTVSKKFQLRGIPVFKGDQYFGDFKYGKPNGDGTFIRGPNSKKKAGNKIYGKWKDGLPNGTATNTNANGNVYTGEYTDGKRNGKFNVQYADGKKFVGIFKDSKKMDRAF